MKRNMGQIDRVIRSLIALMVITALLMEIVSGWQAIVLLVLAIVFLVTSYFGVCPLYTLFGIRTCRNHSENYPAK